ncbi:MAG: VWA domain-containing protein [Thermoanaerobaculia bacterium]
MTPMSLRFGIATLAGLLALQGSSPAAGQERGGFGENVEVELVSVDVLATDRDGRPVTDLTAADFRLFDDGEPVPIGHFSAPAGAPGGVGASGGRTVASPALAQQGPQDLLILFIDQLHLIPSSRQRALDQVTGVRDERLDRGSEVMVATFEGSIDVALAPTRDRKKLQEVLTRELLYGSQALAIHREDSDIQREVRETLVYHVEDLVRASFAANEIMDLACTSTSNVVKLYAEQEMARIEGTAQALEEFLESLAAYPGRKTMLHVSDGFSMVAGVRPMQYLISLCDGSAHFQGLESDSFLARATPSKYFAASAQLEMEQWDTVDLWRSVVARANAERVTLHDASPRPDGPRRRRGGRRAGDQHARAHRTRGHPGGVGRDGGRDRRPGDAQRERLHRRHRANAGRADAALRARVLPAGGDDEEIPPASGGRASGVSCATARATSGGRRASGLPEESWRRSITVARRTCITCTSRSSRAGDDTKTVEVDVELRIALADLVLVPQWGSEGPGHGPCQRP